MRKAEKLRRETGELRWQAPLEKIQQTGLYARLEKTLGKPFKILFQEPMLIAVTAYMSVSHDPPLSILTNVLIRLSLCTELFTCFLKHTL